MLRRGSAFNGFSLEATDGKVGTITDLLFDDSSWKLRWLVVDTGTWLSERKILIAPSALAKVDIEGRAFPIELTRAQVEASPSISRDEPVSMHMENELTSYYRYNNPGGQFEVGTAAAPFTPAPALRAAEHCNATTADQSDPHLRSIAEVSSYEIRAIDGTIGHLETFLIDDENWTIRYLVVDTANWWIGKHVLVAPAAVTEFAWGQRFVRLNLTCYKIKGSPAWDSTSMVERTYEQLLKIYYGWGTSGDDTKATAVAAREVKEPV